MSRQTLSFTYEKAGKYTLLFTPDCFHEEKVYPRIFFFSEDLLSWVFGLFVFIDNVTAEERGNNLNCRLA